MNNPTAFQTAAREGDLEKVKTLLKDNADLVFSTDNHRQTPLHLAAGASRKDVVELLLASGAVVNARDEDGRTPLHHAAANGHKNVAELLLPNKAKVNIISVVPAHWSKDTPLHAAARGGHKDVVELLLAKKKAWVREKNNKGDTPLHAATSGGHKEVAELLLAANKAIAYAKNNRGETPLQLAAAKGHKDVEEFLLANKPAVFSRLWEWSQPLFGFAVILAVFLAVLGLFIMLPLQLWGLHHDKNGGAKGGIAQVRGGDFSRYGIQHGILRPLLGLSSAFSSRVFGPSTFE